MVKKICTWMGALLLLSACEESFSPRQNKLELFVAFDNSLGGDVVSNASYTLQHSQKSITYSGKTDTDGRIVLNTLEPGIYNIHVSITLGVVDAQTRLGYNYSDSLLVQTAKILHITNDIKDTIRLFPTFKSNIIIKEFYYTGSTLPSGNAYNSDQYIEIYNNSNEPVNISGLLIAEHESSGNGFNPWIHISDSVVVKMIWRIPDTGNQSMLLPGESAVLARDAIDHKSDPNGNPNSPVNLANADFEFYVHGNEAGDIDAPAVNLIEELFVYRGTDVTFHTRNGGGIMLLQPDIDNLQEWLKSNMVKKYTASGSSFTLFAKIPNRWVVDAVDVLRDAGSGPYKRFVPELDGGFTFSPGGSTSGTCIRRKVASRDGDRVIYLDTNNSTVDFLNNQIPNPGVNE
jgi:hypothetical protein